MNILLTILTIVVPIQELSRRIALDFNRSQDDVKTYIQMYYPDVDSMQITRWEESKALEYKIVDGEKRYFKNAAQNMFRIDRDARRLRETREGAEKGGRAYIIREHVKTVLSDRKEETPLCSPHKWTFFYRLYLPQGLDIEKDEEIKVWLPYPNTATARQKNVQIKYSNNAVEIHDSAKHASAFMIQKYNANKPTVFEIKYTFTAYAEYHSLPKEFKHKDIDKNSTVLKPYLEERTPHCLFTNAIQTLADSIIGNETRPYYKARRLFEAMRELYPWASAREYSTIENIPHYVIENGHGDCGQIAMLYITLCRYAGIPARWQSGFMLHPGYENLHDWAEIYIEGLGWIPVDPSFGVQKWGNTEEERYFYFGGIDAFRLIINTDWGCELLPEKQYERSETVDFQRGEVETKKRNLYFDTWKWEFKVSNTFDKHNPEDNIQSR